MKPILRTLAAALLVLSAFIAAPPARAQLVPPGHVLGNGTSSAHTPTDVALVLVMSKALCATTDSVAYYTGGAWSCLGMLGTAHSWLALQTFSNGATVQGSFTATGLVTNADLANSSITIGATPISLGATLSAATGRGSSALNVDAFTGHGDSTYAIQATDKVVGTNAALTGSRTWTLPAANAVNPGQPLVVADFQGTVTGVNTLVISRAAADTINGGSSVTINSANGAYILWSDGISKWTAQAIGASAVSGVTTFNGRSGAVVPTQGDYSANLIPGTTTNDNATAGNIGEYVTTSVVSGSSVAISSTGTTIGSISLTAGDWDVSAQMGINTLSGTGTILWLGLSISTTTNTPGTFGTTAKNVLWTNVAANIPPNNILGVHVGPHRLSLAGTTTVYFVGDFGNSGSFGLNGYGQIRARRVR